MAFEEGTSIELYILAKVLKSSFVIRANISTKRSLTNERLQAPPNRPLPVPLKASEASSQSCNVHSNFPSSSTTAKKRPRYAKQTSQLPLASLNNL